MKPLYTATMSCLVEAADAEEAALKATAVHRDLSSYFVEVTSPDGDKTLIFAVHETAKASLTEEVLDVPGPTRG